MKYLALIALTTYSLHAAEMKHVKEYEPKKIASIFVWPDFINYTPTGKQNAMLLLKVLADGNSNTYLWGYLFGYDEKDIKAEYQRVASLVEASENYVDKFNNEKK